MTPHLARACVLLGLFAAASACRIPVTTRADEHPMTTPTYTFVSVSTARPGRLDDLVRIASRPSELMAQRCEGLIARQVSVDRDRNTVIVWVTFDEKETLYDYLASEQGKRDHGEDDPEMAEIIETFEMYDLEPVSGSL